MNNTEKMEKEQIIEDYLEIVSNLEVMNFILKDSQDLADDIELVYGLKSIVSTLCSKFDYELISKLKY